MSDLSKPRRWSPATLLGIVAIASLGAPGTAHAYLDAASGSMIIQAVITAVMGGLFIFRNQWRRIKSFFTSEQSESEVADSPDEPQQ